jgi:hypothetical protein
MSSAAFDLRAATIRGPAPASGQICTLVSVRPQGRASQRPRPSIETRTPASFSTPMRSELTAWPVLKFSSLLYRARACSSAAAQIEASIVFDSRKERTLSSPTR